MKLLTRHVRKGEHWYKPKISKLWVGKRDYHIGMAFNFQDANFFKYIPDNLEGNDEHYFWGSTHKLTGLSFGYHSSMPQSLKWIQEMGLLRPYSIRLGWRIRKFNDLDIPKLRQFDNGFLIDLMPYMYTGDLAPKVFMPLITVRTNRWYYLEMDFQVTDRVVSSSISIHKHGQAIMDNVLAPSWDTLEASETFKDIFTVPRQLIPWGCSWGLIMAVSSQRQLRWA